MGKHSKRNHNPNWRAEQEQLARKARRVWIHDQDAKTLVFSDRKMSRGVNGELRRTTKILKQHETVTHAKENGMDLKGVRFYSQTRQKEMMLITEGEWNGWLVQKHPDGQWVSLRRATQSDRDELAKAAAQAQHQAPA